MFRNFRNFNPNGRERERENEMVVCSFWCVLVIVTSGKLNRNCHPAIAATFESLSSSLLSSSCRESLRILRFRFNRPCETICHARLYECVYLLLLVNLLSCVCESGCYSIYFDVVIAL